MGRKNNIIKCFDKNYVYTHSICIHHQSSKSHLTCHCTSVTCTLVGICCRKLMSSFPCNKTLTLLNPETLRAYKYNSNFNQFILRIIYLRCIMILTIELLSVLSLGCSLICIHTDTNDNRQDQNNLQLHFVVQKKKNFNWLFGI